MTQLTRQDGGGVTDPPAWVWRRLEGARLRAVSVSPGLAVHRADGGQSFTLVRATVPRTDQLEGLAFQRSVVEAHGAIAKQLRASEGPRYPVRCWNFVPGIQRAAGVELDRYMIFNAGRYAAYADWYRDAEPAAYCAAASAVDVRGGDMVVQVLAAAEPGQALENTRQVPAYRYSTRYGPLPPCFARATLIRDGLRDQLLVSGTASVVGEASQHVRNLEKQLHETFRNLAELVASAMGVDRAQDEKLAMDEAGMVKLLGRYRSLRVYVVRKGDMSAIEAAVRRWFAGVTELTLVPADLCRPELLVEIEGVADVQARAVRHSRQGGVEWRRRPSESVGR